MTWVCKNCNSNNDDSLVACELCGCTEKLAKEKFVLTREKALSLDIVSGAVVVPSEYNVIGERAFESNTNIKTVVLHGDVLCIYKQAFKDCVNLENVVCEGALESIGPEAFRNCRALKNKPTAKTVDASAFKTDALLSREERTPTPTPARKTATVTDTVDVDKRLREGERARLKEYRNKIICKVFAVILPIIALIVGQLVQYGFYFKYGTAYPISLFVYPLSPIVVYVSSACCLVSVIHVIIRSCKLIDEGERGISIVYFVSASIFSVVVPIVFGYVGIIATSLISLLYITYNEEKVPLVPAFLSCAAGLAIMWLGYAKSDYIFCFSEFTSLIDADPFRVKIYLGVATGVGIIATILITAGMAWLTDSIAGNIALGVFCLAMLIIPSMAIPGLLIYAIAVVVISKSDSENVIEIGCTAIIIVLCLSTVGLGIYSFVGEPKTEGIYSYETAIVSTLEDTRQYLNDEVVALDISNVSDTESRTIVTGENCKLLILKSDYKKEYSLTIETAAEKVILCDVNIEYGGLVLKAENVEIKLYGRNEIKGSTGNRGSSGKDGEAGKAAISGKNITFTGKGLITLTSGDGGTGGMGEKGSNGSFATSGGKGGTGGKGGNSGYAIDCEKADAHDFTGKITLKKGSAGNGGEGGPGGDGGFFAGDGKKGDRGEKGEVVDYCSGEIAIDEKRVKRA